MLRHAETAKSGQSKNMANERKWHELLTSGLSSTEHRFKEGPWQEQQIPRRLEHFSMKEFLLSTSAKCSSLAAGNHGQEQVTDLSVAQAYERDTTIH